MNNKALKVMNIGKEYKIGERIQYNTLRGSISNYTSNFYRKFISGTRQQSTTASSPTNPESISNPQENKKHSREIEHGTPNYIWSLKDVSFDVSQGEILGIIGRNGAGKSTLLKIISGVTEPTTGRIEIYGRIGSLLEVGTGFHPELTGRENIYLNGAIIGMRRQEIISKFDAIVDFSGVEEFIDTPVKFYSSGMRVRLGFSVAAHLDPEILLLDEVLAVGDAAFQKKCLEKIKNLTSKHGKTILFISHDLIAINSLCQRTILLDNGKVVGDGLTKEVLGLYSTMMDSTREMLLTERGDASNSKGNCFFATTIRIDNDKPNLPIRPTSRLKISIKYRNEKSINNPIVQLQIKDYRTGRAMTFLNSDGSGELPKTLPPEGTIVCVTDQINFTYGRCTVDLFFLNETKEIIFKVENAATFAVEPEIIYGTEDLIREDGMLFLDHTWLIET